jgi:ABC-2 type transport system permease protein
MIRFLLSLFSPFRWFIQKMGADYSQFISLLRIKLTIDNRSVRGINRRNERVQENMLIKQSISQIIFGGLFGIFLSIVKQPFTFYYFAHIFIMVMMAVSIISEFSSILFDTSENAIILPLPIKGNTVSLARNAHILIYLALMAFSLSVIWVIIAAVKFSIISALFFMASMILNIVLTLFLCNILYLGIMRIATGEQLKTVMMYFQIIIAIIFMAGYQIGFKLVDKSNITDMVLPVHWYTFLVPPAFLSGFITALSDLNFDTAHLLFLIEALIVPVASIYIAGKYLTPIFNRKLLDLEQGDRSSGGRPEASGRSFWYRIMAFIFTGNIEDKASFRLMWKMIGRERTFKQRLLPSIGYIIIMVVVQFINKPVSLDKMADGNSFIFVLYLMLFIAVTIPASLLAGNNPNAAWLFKVIPVSSPANFFKGFINAAFTRFFLPFYLVAGIAVCIIWGLRVIPDVLIALMATYLFTILFYYLQTAVFPFSIEKTAAQGGGATIKMFLIMVLAGLAGFLHASLLKFSIYGNLFLILIYAALIYFINKVFIYKKLTWKTIDKVNIY